MAALLWSSISLSAQNVTDEKGRKQGAWTKSYPNGGLMYEGSFKDDKPVGLFKHYYESGKLKIEQNHLPDNVSEVKMYEINGKNLAATGKYTEKNKDGEWKYYSENKLVLTENFKNGKKEGVSYVYSKAGTVLEEIPYREDKITGIRKFFLEDGKLYSEISYRDGVEDGFYKLYEGNNKPVAEGRHAAGKKDGDWNYYENGKIIETLKYRDGVLLNDKELKKKYENTFDERERNKGKFREPSFD